MKYQQEEFPLLASPRQQSDGFGHMVEKEEEDEEQMPVTSEESNQLESKNTRITELETQLSDQNELKQKLTEAKARLEQLKREKWAKTCDVPKDFFEYNDDTDEVKAIDDAEFDKYVDQKCGAKQNRERKKVEMKNKMLEQVKQTERRKRGLSVCSVTSFAYSDTSSMSKVRPRSIDSDTGGDAKHSRVSLNQITA